MAIENQIGLVRLRDLIDLLSFNYSHFKGILENVRTTFYDKYHTASTARKQTATVGDTYFMTSRRLAQCSG